MTNLMPKNKMLKSLQSFLVLKNFSFLISNSLFFQLATVHKNTKISISKNLTSRLPIRDSLFVPFSLTVVTRTNTKTVHKLLWLIYNIFCDTPLFLMSLSHFRILFAYELCLRLGITNFLKNKLQNISISICWWRLWVCSSLSCDKFECTHT